MQTPCCNAANKAFSPGCCPSPWLLLRAGAPHSTVCTAGLICHAPQLCCCAAQWLAARFPSSLLARQHACRQQWPAAPASAAAAAATPSAASSDSCCTPRRASRLAHSIALQPLQGWLLPGKLQAMRAAPHSCSPAAAACSPPSRPRDPHLHQQLDVGVVALRSGPVDPLVAATGLEVDALQRGAQ